MVEVPRYQGPKGGPHGDQEATQANSLQQVWKNDPRSEGLEHRSSDAAALLAQPPRRDARRPQEEVSMTRAGVAAGRGGPGPPPDLGDLVIVLLASTLAGLRDRLADDGFGRAADLVCDLVELADDYIIRLEG
jgi:hypothetical protein